MKSSFLVLLQYSIAQAGPLRHRVCATFSHALLGVRFPTATVHGGTLPPRPQLARHGAIHGQLRLGVCRAIATHTGQFPQLEPYLHPMLPARHGTSGTSRRPGDGIEKWA